MSGGRSRIGAGEGYALTMPGPVVKVADGVIAEEMLHAKAACHLFGLYVAPALRPAGVGRRLA